MEFLIFIAGVVVICAIILVAGLFILLYALIFKRKKSTGIALSLFGGIPLLLIFLLVFFAFFYVSDNECKSLFKSDMNIELPASTNVIYKDFAPVIWTDYDEAFIAKMNEDDLLYLLNIFKERSPDREKNGEKLFIGSACRDVLEKAGLRKEDVIWFDYSAKHHKTVGFYKEKNLMIYSKFRY